MTTATARYISNGFIVNWQGAGGGGVVVPPSVYAASVPEVVYWLGRIFDPVAASTPLSRSKNPAPSTIVPADDPLLGQQASVEDVASGGFLVRQLPSAAGAKFVETYCVDMDAVHGQLNLIFAPPA